MTSTPEPVKQYLLIEIWDYENGRVGWKVSDLNEKPIIYDAAGSLVMELAEHLIAGESHDVVMSILFRDDGAITTRRPRDRDFREFLDFLWLKGQLHKSCHNIMYREPARTPKILYWIWSVQWIWSWLRGRLKARQNTPAVAATHVPATPADVVSEPSEGLPQASQGAGGTVVQFPR